MLSIHIRPAGIASMRYIAVGYDAVQTVEFVLIDHASVSTSRSSLRQRREQFSPLLLGCFDLLV